MRRTILAAVVLGICSTLGAPAHAGIVVSDLNLFRELRGDNNLGFVPGDRIQFGADVIGGSSGTYLSAEYAPRGFTVPSGPCGALTVNPNFCARTTAFASAPRDNPWTFVFTRPGEELRVTGPSVNGIDLTVPHPTSVTISGNGTTPTIRWTLPSGYSPDGLRVNIYDRSRTVDNGTADIIHSTPLDPATTSYTIPARLSSGGTLVPGGQYSISFQVIETRGDVRFTGLQSQILSRANSYFNFTPLAGGSDIEVHLPMVSGGAFHFTVDEVGPDHITFIDPEVAIGYVYAIGAGDPNFDSVLLPEVGDDLFQLVYGGTTFVLKAGERYFFPDGGVSEFKVLGIETGAMLDPDDPLAFMTGLTFVAEGRFTGTMTPITAFVDGTVPVPATLALFGLGFVALGAIRR